MFENDSPTTSERPIFTVSQLNRRAKQLLETHLPLIWVEGEISNFARPSSGHWYFTLKDDQAQVRCAMFRGRNQQVRFNPQQGQQVLLRARVSLYENRGDYQLIAEHMEEAGAGALQRAFEALKHKLAQEGLFDPARKRPIPALPRHIGVITSGSGAAVRDILTVLQRRFPSIPVTLVPVPVQGKDAAPAIVEALSLANRSGLFDVLILGRGGGSLEDLWPFNEEIVARAIAASDIPVVSAVGHEVDVTIADFVADLRAPTPSAAAELVVPDASEWLARFRGYTQRLTQLMRHRLQAEQHHLQHLSKRLRHPGERLQQQSQRLDNLELRLRRAMQQRLIQARQRLDNLAARQKAQRPEPQLHQWQTRIDQLRQRLNRQMQQTLKQQRQRLSEAGRLLHGVSPLNTLERGYAIVHNDAGEVIRDAAQVKPGERIRTRVAAGEILSRVEE
ncbi:exodeoxyribonuclease VII large subunit [Marinimicrobium sp. C6131]|uniref:exodeoxyribonuclease VII large subunit n=1 Tax=Marinimicrobium sp. C6131 TaxID=3022676 RepID=UPI00223DEFD5|nr:exodeoxyribonuclease VII large subunit [Marinimicrobium sp. C6131]UZJ45136.1 exodeoxyribonuclease VII large subunit [Marinimicrobium sp. C6131]